MNKKLVFIFFSGIVFVASLLRFWQLGAVPISPDWDEVALGYNAYSILHTGRDEYGTFLPLELKSYGDYKPALYAYLTIPSIAVFGLSTFATRFPSAFFGVLTVLVLYFFAQELFKRRDIALLSSLLLAISPWHIQFSRVAFETNIGIFFNVLGALLFLKGFKKPTALIFSAAVFASNLYAYQSEKVFTPLLVLLLIVLFRKHFLTVPKKYIVIAACIGILIIAPMIQYTFFNTNGLARAQGVSIFSSSTKLYQAIQDRYKYNKATHDWVGLLLDNKRFVYAKQITGNYLSHFSINWLFISGDISRHHAPDMGLIYIWELPFILIGLYQLLFGEYDKKTKFLIFGWLLFAPIPASITNDVPHAVRTMNSLPMYQIFTALGIVEAYVYVKKRKFNKFYFRYILLGIFILFASYNFLYYVDQYFVQLNYFDAIDWQYGYGQIVPQTQQLGKSYTHIVVDAKNQFSQSYMFYLFYLQFDPAMYQKEKNQVPSATHQFGKYIFRPIQWEKDSKQTNTLFVGSPGDFSESVPGIKKMIYTTDNKVVAEFVGR